MRTKSDNGVISVRAISGTRVVVLGLDVKGYQNELTDLMSNMSLEGKKSGAKSTKAKKSPFIGFSITRTNLATSETVSLNEGGRPIQKFLWGDYEVEPGTEYEYTIRQLTSGRGFMSLTSKVVSFGGSPLQVKITTEDPSEGTHGIYFNRGVAGSHAYNEKFGDFRKWHLVSKYGVPVWRNIINPREIPDQEMSKEALTWLSRGLEEALLGFISQATGNNFQIRAAVYEFTHKDIIQALANAVERGVDVKIIRHCKGVYHPKVRRNSIVKDDQGNVVKEWIPDTTAEEAEHAIRKVGFNTLDHARTWHHGTFIERRHSSALMHNKFIILLQNGTPMQVWTGSTNFTDGGIYGQSNVGHILRDRGVAERYLSYWNTLSLDPPGRSGMHRYFSDESENKSVPSDDDKEENTKEVKPEPDIEQLDDLEASIVESSTSSVQSGINLSMVTEEPMGEQSLLFAAADNESFFSKSTKSDSSVKVEQEPIDSEIEKEQADLDGPLVSNTIKVIFSPRKTTRMLQFYADRMHDATESVHLTAPFGVSQQFGHVLNQTKTKRATASQATQDGLRRSPRIAAKRNSGSTEAAQILRYVLFDKKPSERASTKSRASAAKKGTDYVDYFDFKELPENRIAYGAVLDDEENGLKEDLTGLTSFVDFIHLKCLLIDATTDHPTVITGSANFSEASTDRNDENMLIIHGDCAVADVYFTEYMRLFNHFYSRDNQPKPNDSPKQKKKLLRWGETVGDESWLQPYFDPTNQLYRERMLLH